MTEYPVHAGDTVTIRARSDGGWLCPNCEDNHDDKPNNSTLYTWDALVEKVNGLVVELHDITSISCTWCGGSEAVCAIFTFEGQLSWCPIIWCEPMEVADALYHTI